MNRPVRGVSPERVFAKSLVDLPESAKRELRPVFKRRAKARLDDSLIKKVMQELGKRGGKSTSKAKARAVKKNGQKGGRPPKPKSPSKE